MPVDVLVQGRAVGVLPVAIRQQVAKRLRTALRFLGRSRSSVTLVLTDDVEIRRLNRDYRAIDHATDVLSFHLQKLKNETDPGGQGVHLGDIVISLETARRRMPRGPFGRELERLAIHGLCHLFGHDHKRKPQAVVMRALERRLRAAMPTRI